jgi:Ca2+-transporting ATPase
LALSEAQTMAVTSIIALQIFYLLSCRSLKRSIFSIGLFTNPTVFLGIAAILALQAAFVYLPALNSLFDSAPLGPDGWLRAFAVGGLVWPVVTLEKWWRRRQPTAPARGEPRS